jgi:hypothetical protein
MATSLTSTRVALSTMAGGGKGFISEKVKRTDLIKDEKPIENIFDANLK